MESTREHPSFVFPLPPVLLSYPPLLYPFCVSFLAVQQASWHGSGQRRVRRRRERRFSGYNSAQRSVETATTCDFSFLCSFLSSFLLSPPLPSLLFFCILLCMCANGEKKLRWFAKVLTGETTSIPPRRSSLRSPRRLRLRYFLLAFPSFPVCPPFFPLYSHTRSILLSYVLIRGKEVKKKRNQSSSTFRT